MRLAVIVTTYNRPDALAAVLSGYLAQTDADFELIIADDGSGSETAEVIAEHQRGARISIRHVWQEDRGFRAGAVRNRALAHTDADYVIFTDGDCIPAVDFVREHRRLAEQGYFLAGNRVLLSKALTDRVLTQGLAPHTWGPLRWARARLDRDINRVLPLLRLPNGGFLRKLAPQQWRGVKTCNLSAWRADLLRVNGFDEAYSGWGLEDSDLVVRLLRAGVRHKTARFAAPVFHLWHRENDRSALPENQARLAQLLASTSLRAGQGLQQYL
jgi:glycosyltransferase involved in cell wall biosynthesis